MSKLLAFLALAALLSAPGAVTARERPPSPDAIADAALAELNYARTDPAGYARTRLDRSTEDGAAETAAYLRRQRPAPALNHDPRVAMAAARHAADVAERGGSFHTGSDGSGPLARMQRVQVWAMTVAEEASVGQATPTDIVRVLLIDSGVPNLAHRKDLMDPHMIRAGIGCAPSRAHGLVCIINMTGPLLER